MTIIAERRGEIDAIAGFLVLVLGFAAFRGAAGAPVVAAILAVLAVGIAIAWIAWRRKPRSMLAISAEEIFFGRLDQAGTVITRGAGGLVIRHGVRNSGWFLVGADESGGDASISLIGFDPGEVRRACEAHGWTVG